MKNILRSKREIYRIHTAHTLRSIALSMVSVYIPVYLLVEGYSLTQVIFFYVLFHLVGVIVTIFGISPLISKFGPLKTIKLYYPLEIIFYILLYLLSLYSIPIWIVAIVGGSATFMYWVPLNILLLKHSDFDKMGSDLATFFALPKVFQVVGPLIAAIFVFSVGFWFIFLLAMIGLIISFLPIASIASKISVDIKLNNIVKILKRRKKLFILEIFDNIIEESEWFWGIYVYLIVDTLLAPGIVGSLVSVGSILFLLLVGKYANKNSVQLIKIGAGIVVLVSLAQIFIREPMMVYMVTVISSFAMTLLLVPYFSFIYKKIKNKQSEEFIILREIPTVIGRLIVFGTILLCINHLQYFFILPAMTGLILLIIFLTKIRQA